MLDRLLLPASAWRGCLLFLVSLATAAFARAQAPAITFSGDLRLRYENDWDSRTAAGVPRADRERARVRARLAASVKLSETVSLGARVRTGNPDSQQSTHLSFWSSDDQEDDLEGNFDRYFIQYKEGPVVAWAGRNNLPFWQQNELFWDEDVTPTGFSLAHESKLATGTLTTTGGAFMLPDGAVHLHGTFVGGQVRYVRPVSSGQVTVAAGLHALNGKAGAELLRNRNGERDYLIGVLSGQWATAAGGLPLTFGVDLIENFASYDAADVAPFAPGYADETSGYVLSALAGQLRAAGDWQLGYFYARIETLAVNASYAQDDWARFGSGPQSDVTDFQGHELRAAYAFTPNLNVMARLFLVEAITTPQDGNRVRVDLNWRF